MHLCISEDQQKDNLESIINSTIYIDVKKQGLRSSYFMNASGAYVGSELRTTTLVVIKMENALLMMSLFLKLHIHKIIMILAYS